VLAGGLEWADPTDLDGLREALELADPEGRLAPVGMSRVEIGPEALSLLPEVVSEFAGGPRVVLVVDPTPMRRDGDDLKSEAERLLGGRFEVRRAVIGEGRGALHADEAALDETAAAVSGADCVVVVGSGTITDVAKGATARAGTPGWWSCRPPLRSTPSPTTWRCCSRAGLSAPSSRADRTRS
jgi:glycerol-1-phosphate dehydrogenase [NAD(P)+]